MKLILPFLATIFFIIQSSGAQRKFSLHPNPISDTNVKLKEDAVSLISCFNQQDSHAFISGGKEGIIIVDYSKVESPKIVGKIPAKYASSCGYGKNHLFIGDELDGAIIYNVSDILNPKKITTINKPMVSIQHILVTADSQYLYILSNGMVLCFYIGDVAKPQILSAQGILSPNSYRIRFDINEEYIAVSNHLMGIQIIDVRNKMDIKLRVNQIPMFVSWDALFTPDNKGFYTTDAYFGLFYADVSEVMKISPSSSEMVSLTFTNLLRQSVLVISLGITNDGKFLLVGLRSIGMYLFEIKNNSYEDLNFIQHIQGSYMGIEITIFKENNEKFVFLSNGLSLVIYESVAPSTNQDFPNLLNTFQSSLITHETNVAGSQAICLSNGKSVIWADTQLAVSIFSISDPYYPQLISKLVRAQTQGLIWGASTTQDDSHLLVASSENGVQTYDIQDLTNPKLMSVLKPNPYGNQVMSVGISQDNATIVISNSFYGLAIADYSDLTSPVVKQIYFKIQACGFQSCILLKNSINLVCACREVGIFFFKRNDASIDLLTVVYEIGPEQVLISSDEKTLFVPSGFQGFIILDISDFFKPVKKSQLILTGSAKSAIPVFDEKYMLVSEEEKGQVSLINIQNIQAPYVQQIISFQNESSSSLCVTPDERNLYFIGTMGMRYIPIQTDLVIHTQYQVQIFDDAGYALYFDTLDPGTDLLVGQVVYLTFNSLYTNKFVKIQKVKYYRYFEKQDLPTWMTFLPAKKQVILSVNKLGAINDYSTEANGENIIILIIAVQIFPEDFILSGQIDSNLANQIYQTLQQDRYINAYGELTDIIDPLIPFRLNFYNTEYPQSSYTSYQVNVMMEYIKKILVFSKVEYPIRFFIKSSLKFNYKNKRSLKNENNGLNVIETPSTQVKIYLQIESNGKFVKKTFEGVLASFSDDLTSVQISGQTSYVDLIVSNNIQVANSTSNLADVKVYILLSDSSNYDITLTVGLDELPFFTLHQSISIDPNNRLQKQLEKYYSNGDMSIESQFSFGFSQLTFIQPDNLPLTYKAYILNSDDSKRSISTGDWIEFSEINFSFCGKRTVSYLFSKTKVKVIATDGYSDCEDTFHMQFTVIPFFFGFQIAVQILCPLIGLIGVWQFRHQIHLFLVERSNMHSDDYAVIGQMYKKQIILMGEIQKDVCILWNIYLKKNRQEIANILEEYKNNQCINFSNLIKKVQGQYIPIKIKFKNIDPREFEFCDSRLVRIIKRYVYQIILQNDKKSLKAFNLLKQHGIRMRSKKDWYKLYVKVFDSFDVVEDSLVRTTSQQKLQRQSQQLKNPQQQEFQDNQQNNLEISFQKQEISPCSNQKQGKVITFNPMSTKIGEHNNNSMNFKFPSGELKFEMVTQKVLETQNVQIQHQDEEQQHIQDKNISEQLSDLNPFPDMEINSNVIKNSLNIKNKFTQSYDLNLISEIIILEASGCLISTPNSFNPTVGESLHVSQHDLLTFQAFVKNTSGIAFQLLDFLNLNYHPIGLQKNNPLPSWLNYKIIDGIIFIWGIPDGSDEVSILMRLINSLQITVYSYKIIIQDNQENDRRDRYLIRKSTTFNQTHSTELKHEKRYTSNHSSNLHPDNKLKMVKPSNEQGQTTNHLERLKNYEIDVILSQNSLSEHIISETGHTVNINKEMDDKSQNQVRNLQSFSNEFISKEQISNQLENEETLVPYELVPQKSTNRNIYENGKNEVKKFEYKFKPSNQ